MEHPVREISSIIHSLTQTPPSQQRATIAKYFTPTASFTHPFCATGSFSLSPQINSRALIVAIYAWYKILSPRIELSVDSVAFDEKNHLLYVGIHQVFRIWVVPFYKAPVKLTTVLTLTTEPGELSAEDAALLRRETHIKKRYWIAAQQDLYQTSEFIKFLLPLGGSLLVLAWQYFAVLLCVLGAIILRPISLMEEKYADKI